MTDISDAHIVQLARAWADCETETGVVMALVADGVGESEAVDLVEDASERGLVEYGTSAYYAWPTDWWQTAKEGGSWRPEAEGE